jgi:SAM-dependent methyltransferase
MGTAEVQGELWGAKAADWVTVQEPVWRPVYETVLRHLGVGSGTTLLDLACGAGGALLVARTMGAEVAGLDAAHTLVAIARERLPGARIEIGEMEELPFADSAFDIVTGFNAFQFAGDVGHAIAEAKRVLKPGGKLATLVWGRRTDCELLSRILAPVMSMLPAPPSGSPPAPAFAEPGVIEGLMEKVSLTPLASGEFDCSFAYQDQHAAWRAISSAGSLVRAVRLLGEDKVKASVTGTFGPFTRADGTIAHRNRFRWVIGRA